MYPVDFSTNEKEENTTNKEKQEVSYNHRILLYLIFILINIILTEDFGITSSNSNNIRKHYHLLNKQFSLFAILPLIGKLFFSFFSVVLLSLDKRKLFSFIFMTINTLCLFVYFITDNILIIYLVRFILGASRVFMFFYIPIWIDQFSIEKYKSIMLGIINISSQFGHVYGYSISLFKYSNWVNVYFIDGIISLSLTIILLLFPNKYFLCEIYLHENKSEDNDKDKSIVIEMKVESNIKNYFKGKSEQDLNSNKYIVKKKRKYNILRNPTYIFSLFSKSNILFIYSILSLFITDYLSKVLKIKRKILIFLYFEPISISGKIIGTLIGTLLIKKLTQKSKVLPFILSGIAKVNLILVIPITIVTNILYFEFLLFSFYILTSIILVILSEFIFSSVHLRHKSVASFLTVFNDYLFGAILGPLIYGYLSDNMNIINIRLAWNYSFYYCFIGFFWIAIASIFRYKDCSNREKNKKEKKEKKEMNNDKEGAYEEDNNLLENNLMEEEEVEDEDEL